MESLKHAPVVLFAYKRPIHTQKVIKALQENTLARETKLYVFIDGPKNQTEATAIAKVHDIVKGARGFQDMIIRRNDTNHGLANSVLNGVTKILKKYDKIIVLEDDIVTNKNFLEYMNFYLDHFSSEKKIHSITAFNYPNNLLRIPKEYKYSIYFSPRCMSWSWATWKNRWENVDWEVKDFKTFIKNKHAKKEFNFAGNDLVPMLKNQINGHIDSWAIRWAYAHYLHKSYCVYPCKSMVNNIGFDATATHCLTSKKYKNIINNEKLNFFIPPEIKVNNKISKRNRHVYDLGPLEKIKIMLKETLKYFNNR